MLHWQAKDPAVDGDDDGCGCELTGRRDAMCDWSVGASHTDYAGPSDSGGPQKCVALDGRAGGASDAAGVVGADGRAEAGFDVG